MTDFLDHLSANDNDIYDLLISGNRGSRPLYSESWREIEEFFTHQKIAAKN